MKQTLSLSTSHTESVQPYLEQIALPKPDSHKGQNGKVLILGGSELFHAASKWSLDVASKFVDMVFYSSVPANNELIKEAKQGFWNGIVIPRHEVREYLEESDVVLIGPGMERSSQTQQIANTLIREYPQTKWVIDAGALQMLDPQFLSTRSIITPHAKELAQLQEKGFVLEKAIQQGVTVLVKGKVDTIYSSEYESEDSNRQSSTIKVIEVAGGNAGMTKGGTGDVLAGLVAALYAMNSAEVAAVMASYVNKRAGDDLYQEVGPNFNASDLADQVPRSFWQLMSH